MKTDLFNSSADFEFSLLELRLMVELFSRKDVAYVNLLHYKFVSLTNKNYHFFSESSILLNILKCLFVN